MSVKPEHYDVIVKPLITEKGTDARTEENKYLFVVDPRATKIEIRKAVESLFSVAVESVNTQVYRGKIKRRGKHMGKRSNWKKAIVTLREGETIQLFEGV